MTEEFENMKTIEEIKNSPETLSTDLMPMDLFRDPTREEVVEAFDSLASWVFDQSDRDFQMADLWEEHCMRFLLTSYLDRTNP